jgi:hypothetical protein
MKKIRKLGKSNIWIDQMFVYQTDNIDSNTEIEKEKLQELYKEQYHKINFKSIILHNL